MWALLIIAFLLFRNHTPAAASATVSLTSPIGSLVGNDAPPATPAPFMAVTPQSPAGYISRPISGGRLFLGVPQGAPPISDPEIVGVVRVPSPVDSIAVAPAAPPAFIAPVDETIQGPQKLMQTTPQSELVGGRFMWSY